MLGSCIYSHRTINKDTNMTRYIRVTLLMLALLAPVSLMWGQEIAEIQEYERLSTQGFAYVEAGQSDSALICFTQAIALLPNAPTNYMLHSNISEIYLAKRDTIAALTSLASAIVQQPDMPILRERRAELLGALKRFDEALLDLDHLVALYPTRERTLFARALLKVEMRLYEGAASDLETILHHNEKAYLPRIALAQIAQRQGDHFRGEKLLTQLITTHPNIPIAYRERARLYLTQGQKALAMRDVREVMKQSNKVTYEDYLIRAQVWLLYGENKEARADFSEAQRLGASTQEIEEARSYIRTLNKTR